MQHYFRQLYGICLLLLPIPGMAQYNTPVDAKAASENVLQPSIELLEFLADFGDMDEQTYDIIEYHALQDEKKPDQEESHEQ